MMHTTLMVFVGSFCLNFRAKRNTQWCGLKFEPSLKKWHKWMMTQLHHRNRELFVYIFCLSSFGGKIQIAWWLMWLQNRKLANGIDLAASYKIRGDETFAAAPQKYTFWQRPRKILCAIYIFGKIFTRGEPPPLFFTEFKTNNFQLCTEVITFKFLLAFEIFPWQPQTTVWNFEIIHEGAPARGMIIIPAEKKWVTARQFFGRLASSALFKRLIFLIVIMITAQQPL